MTAPSSERLGFPRGRGFTYGLDRGGAGGKQKGKAMSQRRHGGGRAARPRSAGSSFAPLARRAAAMYLNEPLERRLLLSALPQADTSVSFVPGDVLADPVRDAVY